MLRKFPLSKMLRSLASFLLLIFFDFSGFLYSRILRETFLSAAQFGNYCGMNPFGAQGEKGPKTITDHTTLIDNISGISKAFSSDGLENEGSKGGEEYTTSNESYGMNSDIMSFDVDLNDFDEQASFLHGNSDSRVAGNDEPSVTIEVMKSNGDEERKRKSSSKHYSQVLSEKRREIDYFEKHASNHHLATLSSHSDKTSTQEKSAFKRRRCYRCKGCKKEIDVSCNCFPRSLRLLTSDDLEALRLQLKDRLEKLLHLHASHWTHPATKSK